MGKGKGSIQLIRFVDKFKPFQVSLMAGFGNFPAAVSVWDEIVPFWILVGIEVQIELTAVKDRSRLRTKSHKLIVYS